MSGVLCGGSGPWPPLPPEPVRSVGEDAEWDRNRVEEDPVLWELAMTDKAHREELAKSPPYDVLERKLAEEVGELPLEVEPCQETLRGADGQVLGLACQPVWKRAGFWCLLCDQSVLIMREVAEAVREVNARPEVEE